MRDVVIKRSGRYAIVKREGALEGGAKRYAIIEQEVFCRRVVQGFKNLRTADRVFRKIVPFILAALFFTPSARAAEPDFNPVVSAIYRVEGGARAKAPYGVLAVKCGTRDACRKICYNTVRNNWRRWEKAGRPGAYLDFLADRYCPEKADPIGNRNWKTNIKRMVRI